MEHTGNMIDSGSESAWPGFVQYIAAGTWVHAYNPYKFRPHRSRTLGGYCLARPLQQMIMETVAIVFGGHGAWDDRTKTLVSSGTDLGKITVFHRFLRNGSYQSRRYPSLVDTREVWLISYRQRPTVTSRIFQVRGEKKKKGIQYMYIPWFVHEVCQFCLHFSAK